MAVVLPESVEDVVETVRFAGAHGLRIAFNAGGHNAGPIDWSRDALLMKMERMRGLEIDVEGRRARAEAGVLANSVAHAAGEHGLAYLAGTSPDVGIVGYTLGGGFNWMIRKHGLAANSVLAVELVTADGRLRSRRLRARERPVLGSARRRRELRRGDGDRVRALPHRRGLCRRLLLADRAREEILNAWRAWVETVPVECDSIGRLLQLPDAPFLPDHLRGRSFALVEVAFLGSESDGAALVQPFRDLEPELDNVTMMPARDLSLVNMDPDFPLPYAGDGILLEDYSPAATDVLVESFVGSPLLHARGSPSRRRAPRRLTRSRLPRHDRPAVHPLHVRHRAGTRRCTRPSNITSISCFQTRTVEQRPPLPELHGVAGRPADDLPGDKLGVACNR